MESDATSKKHFQCVSTAIKSPGIKEFLSLKGTVEKFENCKKEERKISRRKEGEHR